MTKLAPISALCVLGSLTASTVLGQVTDAIYVGQAYNFTTLAGQPPGSANGPDASARFNFPQGVASDAAGNLYVADSLNSTIRKISTGGVVTTLAGTPGLIGSADGTGPAAEFAYPSNVAVDGAGNVYVSDSGNTTVRKITPYGVVTTLAGTPGITGSMDATGPAASFMSVNGIAVDTSGNVYVADLGNDTIREISSGGVVSTFAGVTGDTTQLDLPYGVAIDGSGNVYVTDLGDDTVKLISPAGVISPLAGSAGDSGSANGTGVGATFNAPLSIAVDSLGNAYVADDGNLVIREIMPGGVVSTFSGIVGTFGDAGGTVLATYGSPYGVAVDGSGNVYVADAANNQIRKITPSQFVSNLAGAPSYGTSDGSEDQAQFGLLEDLAADGLGNIYVNDSGNIRQVTSAGLVTTLTGVTTNGGLAADSVGDIYYEDTSLGISMRTPGGTVTQIATDGSLSAFGGQIQGLALDGTGNIYVANSYGENVLKVTPGGVVTSYASGFDWIRSVAVDSTGNVYAADWLKDIVYKITPGGVVSTLAGHAGNSSQDGIGTAATFELPTAIAVDGADNVYVVCYYNSRVRKISPAGTVTTIGGVDGLGNGGNFSDGTGAAARFNAPNGIAVDGSGNVYVSDSANFALRKGRAVMAGDFNGDDKADIVWQNTSTTERGVWLMDGTAFSSYVSFGDVASEWQIAGTGDFNGDGQTDVLWQNTGTGECGVWLMNGPAYSSWVSLGIIPTQWRLAGTGKFTANGQVDLLWQNTSTGDCGIWLMYGSAYVGWADLGTISTNWRIVGTGDFNGDGQTDILWQNTSTGECGVWLMNGTSFSSWVSFGLVPLEWKIAGAQDYNGDGNPDILWQNSSTGECGIWLMNGTSFSSWVSFGDQPLQWQMAVH